MKKIITTAVAILFLCTYLLTGFSVFAVTPLETDPDTSTLNDLANIGTPYTDNFTKNLLGLYTYDSDHNYIIENDNSIAGKSYLFDFNNSGFGGCFALALSGKLVAGAKYKLKVDYKFISASAPTTFYFGFKSDVIGDQINRQIDFSGKQSNTVYTYTQDYQLLNDGSYYLQMFTLNANDGAKLVIDNISIERLYVGESYYQETPADSSTLNDLSKVGVPFTENFTKGALGSLWSYDMGHFSVIQDENAIAGKSIMQDFTNASYGGIYAFSTKFKLVGDATYRLSVNYKFLTDTAPTGFYFGFTRDGGVNQKNIKVDFTDKLKDTVYTFTADYTLDDFNDYYLQWFNLSGTDGSKIVIDSLSIELLGNETTDSSVISNLKQIGKPYIENFTKNALNLFSYDMNHFSVVDGSQAIWGKSLIQNFTNAGNGGVFAFATKFNLVAGGTYRLSAKYKVLTDSMPTGFYFGLKRDDPAYQINRQVDFSGKVKDCVYTFTTDITLENFDDYYLQWFNLSGTDGSIISIDSIKLELLDTPSHYTLSYFVSDNNKLSGISLGTNTATFLTGIQKTNGVSVKLYKNDVELGQDDVLATGSRVEINNGTETKSYALAVKGDLVGDGEMNILDLIALRSHVIGKKALTNENLLAAAITEDANIDLYDILAIKDYILQS